MSFYTLSASKDEVLFTESNEVMSIISHLSELKVSNGCPIKTRIALDAIKQWAIICKENKVVCTKTSIIELLGECYKKLYGVLTDEITDYDLKMKYWNESGINFYREKLEEDELRKTRNQM